MKARIQNLFIALPVLALPALVQAQVNYAFSGNTAYVASSPNASGNVVITNFYDGYPVTSIGFSVFSDCFSLTSTYFLGNAPPDNGNDFYRDHATVYYLVGAAGWGSTFGGIPAVLWNPQANSFSWSGGQFGFNLTGPANAVIMVEACTNLSHPVWLPVSTKTLSGLGTSAFSDPTGYPMRYYRFRSP